MMPGLRGLRKAPSQGRWPLSVAALVRLGYGEAVVRALRLLLIGACLWPSVAGAGEARCWYEGGVVVVAAEVMGVAADFVLDTGEPRTLLALTQAQGAGYAETSLAGPVRVAGLEMAARPVAVVPLDARLRKLPTPVAGVLGADLLRGKVLDVSFAPCRVAIYDADRAPRIRRGTTLPLAWRAGRPVAEAAVSDGARALLGDFVVSTGSDTALRLRDDLGDAPGAAEREALYPYGVARLRLRALSFAGDLYENPLAGLVAKAAFDAAGEIGAPVLAAYRLRFDFARDRLHLIKQKGPPGRSDGP